MLQTTSKLFGHGRDRLSPIGIRQNGIRLIPMLGGITRMEKARTYHTAVIWRLLAAGVVPFAVLSCYLMFSRWPTRWFTAASDYIGLIVSVVAGLAFIVSLPIHPSYRIASSFFYILVISAILFFYCFWFVGVVFGDWV